MKKTRYSIQFVLSMLILFMAEITIAGAQQRMLKAGSWGDQLNGTYKNPILNADYSDPDVIRVGDSFYMVCSDFHFMGMPVLKSTDLVNWKIIGQVYNRLDIDPKYSTMEKYGSGSWAPSLRFHNGRFYVYFCTPDEGLYMSSAKDPAGKWDALTEVKRTGGWEDPCPFWDTDGQAYLGHSRLGAGPIVIHKMSADGKHLLDSGKTVYEGPVAEGTKIYKRDNYYYIIIPEGGVATGYETALRSTSIYGPYERKVVLEQGKTRVNGPHQGGLIDLPTGESWFVHFRDAGAIGRVTYLEPVSWKDGWPLMGIDNDGNGIGEPVDTYKKPRMVSKNAPYFIQTSDEFNTTKLGFQWQWNHNPENDYWSLFKNKGYLSLTAMQAADNKHARNTLTQKLMGSKGLVTVKVNIGKFELCQRAGLALTGNYVHEIGVMKTDSGNFVYADNNGKSIKGEKISGNNIYLRCVISVDDSQTQFFYSIDGQSFKPLGEHCVLSSYNYWKAVRPALFSYNTCGKLGVALFDWFHYNFDGTSPKPYLK
ncbi:glycoside hydrolase family 43 protein [Mucilaginibacter rubeus]|uniref:glycoside hydrolase family 43 protein n=1 Tax=Mucilaginibacter rubeus TaxID=2027860 RepID=UPI0016661DF4|nr:glycoside hydrolase 43 family protein [Mucilaginibacter rubeus]GGA96288.1 beta-xylosidase [Mucilaginibacter rubeus]